MGRRTKRKDIIKKLLKSRYFGEPVLLEELRWNVFLNECGLENFHNLEMTRSYRNSFTRTIREYISGIYIQKLPRPDGLHSGIVSRAALYRLNRWDNIQKFLNGDNSTVLARAKRGNSRDEMGRVYCKLYSEYPVKLSFTVGVNYVMWNEETGIDEAPEWEAYKWDKTNLVGTVIFPVSVPLNLVTTELVNAENLKNLAKIGWDVYRDPYPHLNRKPKLLMKNEPIRAYWCGGYLKNPLSRGSWSNSRVE